MRTAIGAGVVLGVLYTLSPLTVLSLAALAALTWWIARDGMSDRERSWFVTIVVVAMGLRLAAIAALFLLADPSRPYGTFFGDEELFKQRTVWLRNVFMGVPIAPADIIYVFDEVGRSSYLYLLAYVQALVGDAPYGLNVLNASWYVMAALILFVMVRGSFGRVPALGGLVLLLFLPTLFSWSVSVLKESLYILIGAIELVLAVQIVRARAWWMKAASLIAVVICAYVLESLRIGGWLLAMVGTAAGVGGAVILVRPRWATVAIVTAPVVLALALLQPAIQQRLMGQLRIAAFNHFGHVATPGFSYRLLDAYYYNDERAAVTRLTEPEAGRFVVRAFYNFVTVPRSSQIQTRAALAYLPEHAVWYAIVVLAPIGIVAGFRRDPVLTCVLVSHGLVTAAMVALTGGNIGTLIRHRGLTIPYLGWLAAVGACHIVHRLAVRDTATALPSGEHA